jgi:hypothetical protein
MVKVIFCQFTMYSISLEFFDQKQLGFRAGHSCTTALFEITEDVRTAAEVGMMTILWLLNFSKAFDSVRPETRTVIAENSWCGDLVKRFGLVWKLLGWSDAKGETWQKGFFLECCSNGCAASPKDWLEDHFSFLSLLMICQPDTIVRSILVYRQMKWLGLSNASTLI